MTHTVVVRAQWVIFHTLCQVCHVFWQEISTLTIHFSFFISRWFQTRQRKNFLMICWILFQLAIDKLQCVTFLLLFCKKIDYDMFPQPCVFFTQFNFLYFKMVLDKNCFLWFVDVVSIFGKLKIKFLRNCNFYIFFTLLQENRLW